MKMYVPLRMLYCRGCTVGTDVALHLFLKLYMIYIYFLFIFLFVYLFVVKLVHFFLLMI